MKIKNESVCIQVGKKKIELHNLILNSYLDLFAESFLKFKNKAMYYCYIKFDTDQEIDIDSRTMQYDTIYECDFYKISETYTENYIINNYLYDKEMVEQPLISDFVGHKITGIGFGDYNYDTNQYEIYAFLNVSEYDIYVQEGEEIVISRKDKISTDLKFYSNSSEVKYPTHLTIRGVLEVQGNDFNTVYSELYSVGFGTLYNIMQEEVKVEDLDFKKIGIGLVGLEGAKDYAVYPNSTLFPSSTLFPGRKIEGLQKLQIKNEGEGLYPSLLLFPGQTYPQKATCRWVIYKFKLYRKRYEGEEEIIEDTGLYYYQSQMTNLIGDIKLKIKYERV